MDGLAVIGNFFTATFYFVTIFISSLFLNDILGRFYINTSKFFRALVSVLVTSGILIAYKYVNNDYGYFFGEILIIAFIVLMILLIISSRKKI